MDENHRFDAAPSVTNRPLRSFFFRVLALTALIAAALASSATAASLHWGKVFRIDSANNGGLNDVACPSSSLCIAVDDSGLIVTSTNPGGGSRAWSSPVRIDTAAGASLTGVACASSKLCVAVDSLGNALYSTKPTGGAKAWKRGRIDSTSEQGALVGLSDVACTTTKLCVAVDAASSGNAMVTSDPTGGARSWKMAKLGSILTSVACPSANLCVAVGTERFVSTNPTGGSSAWRMTGVQGGGGVFSDIACPFSGMCVSVGFGNTSVAIATVSTSPRGGGGSWRGLSLTNIPADQGAGVIDSVACVSRSLCVAIDSANNAFTTTAPASGVWTAPPPPSLAPSAFNSSVACARKVCVLVDSNGRAVAASVR